MSTRDRIVDDSPTMREVVAAIFDEQGHETRARTHMLKMFLIDSNGQVREIYSSAFLLPSVILNDLRTLAMESGR